MSEASPADQLTMRIAIPNYEIGVLILWMEIGVFGVIVAGYFLMRWWRRSHPPIVRNDDLPYSKGLQQRLTGRSIGKTRKIKQSGRSKRSG